MDRSNNVELSKLPYFADNLYRLCEDKFVDAQGHMLDQLELLEQPPRNDFPALNASHTGTMARRLPRIDLPKFSGDSILNGDIFVISFRRW